MEKKKAKALKILTLSLLIIGLLCLIYPAVSNFFYNEKQKEVIKDYDEQVSALPNEVTDKMLEDAKEYNDALSGSGDEDTVSGNTAYSELLKLNDGQMGYIVIPTINVNLPIYHYTDDEVLRVGIGHIENSSLPVGGASTHCLLTGHSGLAGAELFTNLEKLKTGDKFYIKTLDTVLCYEVDRISVVLPNDNSELKITEGKDLVTLITCTPYGINSHRLLVRGTRVA